MFLWDVLFTLPEVVGQGTSDYNYVTSNTITHNILPRRSLSFCLSARQPILSRSAVQRSSSSIIVTYIWQTCYLSQGQYLVELSMNGSMHWLCTTNYVCIVCSHSIGYLINVQCVGQFKWSVPQNLIIITIIIIIISYEEACTMTLSWEAFIIKQDYRIWLNVEIHRVNDNLNDPRKLMDLKVR